MPSSNRKVKVKKEKTTRRSWLGTVLQDPSNDTEVKRPSSASSSHDPRSFMSNGSPVSESEAEVVAFLMVSINSRLIAS